MSTKYTIVGDPHCTLKNLDKINQLFDQVEELGNSVIILGDLLDTKSIVRSECLNLYAKRFSESKLIFYVLVGNHDLHNVNSSEHALYPLKALANVKIIDEVCSTKWSTFVPYIHDKTKIVEILQNIPKDHIVFGHFDLIGFDYGNGHICESGLSIDDFNKFPLVISGHFHKYQYERNFLYLGTPFSHSFGETNQSKCLAILDSSTKQIDLIPTNFPQHITIELNLDDPQIIQEYVNDFNKLDPKHYYRFQLIGSTDNLLKLDKSLVPNLNVKWDDRTTNEVQQSIKLDENLDNKSQFIEWGQKIKQLDNETLQLGLSILGELNAK